MIETACCFDCGAALNLKTFTIVHFPGCPQDISDARSRIDKSVSRVRNDDRKMIFFENWNLIYPDLKNLPAFQPVYDPELKFAEKEMGRGWRFDFAWPDAFVAVEIDGGNRLATIDKNGNPVAVGRHTLDSDYEKRNAAVGLGWNLFCFTVQMVRNDPVFCCGIVYKKICEVISEKK